MIKINIKKKSPSKITPPPSEENFKYPSYKKNM